MAARFGSEMLVPGLKVIVAVECFRSSSLPVRIPKLGGFE